MEVFPVGQTPAEDEDTAISHALKAGDERKRNAERMHVRECVSRHTCCEARVKNGVTKTKVAEEIKHRGKKEERFATWKP